MRISLVSIGSYGDLRPYLALARGLRARGHEVLLHGPDDYARHVDAAGIRFDGLGPHYGQQEVRGILSALGRERDQKKHPEIILRLTRSSTQALAESVVAATRKSDLIVAHNLSVLGFVAAAANRKPYVTGHVFPSLIPSSNLWISGRNFGPMGNRLMWTLAGNIVRRSTDPLFAEVLSRFGIAPRRDMMLGGGHSPLLNLVAVSPSVVPPDPLWAPHYACTGYLRLADGAWEPDEALRAFVEGGEPPLVVSFGSMYGFDAEALTRVLVRAFGGGERRVVLQAGWAGIGEGALPDNMRRTGFVSHDWLFPRAGCVLHHGGAGTVGAALAAGVPQIIAHQLGDQQFWARQVRRLGVGSRSVPLRSLRASWLADAVRRAMEGNSHRLRARQLARRLQQEDGVANAVEAIERVMADGRPYMR